jgi:hypothetical protein
VKVSGLTSMELFVSVVRAVMEQEANGRRIVEVQLEFAAQERISWQSQIPPKKRVESCQGFIDKSIRINEF